MEEFALIIMIIIISLVSGLVRKSKQASQQKQQAARRIQANLQEEMRQEEERLKARIRQEKKQKDIWEQPAAPAYTPVTPPAQMNGEGRDDCHAYMLDNPNEVAAAVETVTDEEREQTANDLIRGVIVSEILHRPRPVYGRRRA